MWSLLACSGPPESAEKREPDEECGSERGAIGWPHATMCQWRCVNLRRRACSVSRLHSDSDALVNVLPIHLQARSAPFSRRATVPTQPSSQASSWRTLRRKRSSRRWMSSACRTPRTPVSGHPRRQRGVHQRGLHHLGAALQASQVRMQRRYDLLPVIPIERLVPFYLSR